jgi:peptide/nickel transport system permease protein
MTVEQHHPDLATIRKQMLGEQRKLRLLRIKSNYGLMIGAAIFLLLLLIAIIGPLFTPYDPSAMKVVERLKAPSSEHWFGTDEFGRDLLTRIIYGARVSIGVGMLVSLLSSLLGLVIGLYASYYRALDHVLMRICDGLYAIPGVLLAIALMAALGASVTNVVIALTIVSAPSVARIVRSAALSVRNLTYIEAMVVQGASSSRIIWRHIMPGTLSPLLVQASFVFAEAIISEAALSFLGVGIPAPDPSWGNILQAGKLVFSKAWWMIVCPGAMIVLSVLSLNLLGDGLRDYLDPRISSKGKKS